MNENKYRTATLICLALAILHGHPASAHGIGPWEKALDWHTDQVAGAFTLGNSAKIVLVDGRECIRGRSVQFKVDDKYAFDIDETVWLDLEFYSNPSDLRLNVSYDRHGMEPDDPGSGKEIPPPKSGGDLWYRQSIKLERARLANLGWEGTDFSISADDFSFFGDNSARRPNFTLCGVTLRRSYATPIRKNFGWVSLHVVNENNQVTPARIGIYDSSGDVVLPSNEAILRSNFIFGDTRIAHLLNGIPAWPVKDRLAYYIEGTYRSRLPTGEYELAVAKGPEYRLVRQRFTVGSGQEKHIRIELHRWTNMAAKGWYSGDGHIHYARNTEHDDQTLLALTRVEDLRLANVLAFDNNASSYLPPYAWKPVVIPDRQASFILAPGQEAPRTDRLGHTISMNLKEPIRDPAEYFLYYKVFENARKQGGLTGYAHVLDGYERGTLIRASRGLTVDVPFGLVDFVEIMMNNGGGATPSTLFDFLNLGYRLSPSAGTDWPEVPGAVRNYVQVDGPFTPQAWFEGLKQGRTFVTNGPILDFSINSHGMGSQIHMNNRTLMSIRIKASLNPDIGALSSLQLIEQGEAVKTVSSKIGAPEILLHHDLSAQHGTWFVACARGKNPDVVAWSAPIYISVEGQSFWKRSEVPSIVARLKQRMKEALSPDIHELTTEGWEARPVAEKYWDAQLSPLGERIARASAIYDDLVKRAAVAPQ